MRAHFTSRAAGLCASGLGFVQGFAAGAWVEERSRWEGTVAEIEAVRPFVWYLDERGRLGGVWEAYNRTFELAINQTVVPDWEAFRVEVENPPEALSGHGLGVDHLCSLLHAAGSGGAPSLGDVADGWARSALEQTSSEAWAGHDLPYTGFGSGFFDAPIFEQLCHNETLNMTHSDGSSIVNVSLVCVDAPGPYDAAGFYRRAPHEQRYAWAHDVLAAETEGGGRTVVVAPLALGEEYIFRVSALYSEAFETSSLPADSASLAAADASSAADTLDAGSSAEASVARVSAGAFSAYSRRISIAVSGPGAPMGLECDNVGPNSMRLRWMPPVFNRTSGLWHGDGGAPLIGYRVLLRSADEPASNMVVAASTRELTITLTDLAPQTLFRIRIVAENTQLRGRHSPVLSVATAVLRATLWSDCGQRSKVFQQMTYQGCFRDVDTPPGAADLPAAAELPAFSHQLSAVLCADACEPHLYFGMREGGHCACGEAFGRYGAVEDHECDTPCTGEASRMCGGPNRTSVYRRSGPHGVLLGVGAYHSYDLIRMRLAARSLSAVSLPAGLLLTLYTRDKLGGMSLNLTSSSSCLREHACAFDASAARWAEPAPRCDDDVWDKQAVSLTLSYTDGPPPAYTPRPSAETGARAFALGTAGMLSRLRDLDMDADMRETNADRPAGPLTQYWRAPRNGDGNECAVRVGEYSSDQICLQASKMDVPALQTNWARANPFKLYEVLAEQELQTEFTDEFARIKRREWRAALHDYARPFYWSRMLQGSIDSSVALEDWLVTWLDGIGHLLPMLSRAADGEPPVLGFDEFGEAVPHAEATAPPMPEHPFPAAEERGDGIVARTSRANGGTRSEIESRRQAQQEIARSGQAAAAATFDAVADGRESRHSESGPTHERMAPYATPKLTARTNQAFEQARREATARSNPDPGDNYWYPGYSEEDENMPFFTVFT